MNKHLSDQEIFREENERFHDLIAREFGNEVFGYVADAVSEFSTVPRLESTTQRFVVRPTRRRTGDLQVDRSSGHARCAWCDAGTGQPVPPVRRAVVP